MADPPAHGGDAEPSAAAAGYVVDGDEVVVVGVVSLSPAICKPAHPDHIGQDPGIEPLARRRSRDDVHPVTVTDLDAVERRGVVAARAQLGPEVIHLHRGRVLGGHLADHGVVGGQPGG